MSIVVCISGYFDPIHQGHLEYISRAKSLGDKLLVIVNNDHQSTLKKGSVFLDQETRLKIVSSLKGVDMAVLSIDDDRTVCKTLRFYRPNIFANGGDQNNISIPEREVCDELDIELVDGLGEKVNSSSSIVRKASVSNFKPEWLGDRHDKTHRQWGFYERILPSDVDYQIKRLTIKPGMSTSLQTHRYSKEFWVCIEGRGRIVKGDRESIFSKDDFLKIELEEKHRITNDGDSDLIVIEIQTGTYLGEDDIIRY